MIDIDYLATGKTASIESALHLAWVEVAQTGSLGRVRAQEVLSRFQYYYSGPIEDAYTESVFGEIDRRLDAVREKHLERRLDYNVREHFTSEGYRTAARNYVRKWMAGFTQSPIRDSFLRQFTCVDLSLRSDRRYLPLCVVGIRPGSRLILELEHTDTGFNLLRTQQTLVGSGDYSSWVSTHLGYAQQFDRREWDASI